MKTASYKTYAKQDTQFFMKDANIYRLKIKSINTSAKYL